jgi:dimethylhistidine N-methyltransferase
MKNPQPVRPEALLAQAPAPTDAATDSFAQAMIDGLTRKPKQTSPKWLYDARGSALFEQITALPEYGLTRTEIALLKQHLPEMVAGLAPGQVVVELGSGSSRKTPMLLRALNKPAAYAPVDISASALAGACAELKILFPDLALVPVVADFTQTLQLPDELGSGPRLGFFPGSTLGNFSPDQARHFLAGLRRILGPASCLLLGLDTVKDEAGMLSAYDDAAGVTAAFNLNLLERMNRELDTRFDCESFAHQARWNAAASRIEMHIVSRIAQSLRLPGHRIDFAVGETIHTENSYKYRPAAAHALFASAGWQVEQSWLASGDEFAVYRLRAPA